MPEAKCTHLKLEDHLTIIRFDNGTFDYYYVKVCSNPNCHEILEIKKRF